MKFIEWVHLMRLLGAERIYFSYEFLHLDFFKVMKHFESQSIVEAWPYFKPSGIRDEIHNSIQGSMLEVNMINDCFYRVQNLYEFVAVVDFDEVLMPLNKTDMNWNDLMERRNMSKEGDYYAFENIQFPDLAPPPHRGIPTYMHMLQHTRRKTSYIPGNRIKSLVRTETAKICHNHVPVICNDKPKCEGFIFPVQIAQSSHYRETRGFYGHVNMSDTITDRTVWKFKDPLITAVHQTLQSTQFQP